MTTPNLSCMATKEELSNKLTLLLRHFVEENEIELQIDVDKNTRLIGTTSIFDSMELVQFIVEVEDFLEENYDMEIQLTSEKAMSRRNSPFLSIEKLSIYIAEESFE